MLYLLNLWVDLSTAPHHVQIWANFSLQPVLSWTITLVKLWAHLSWVPCHVEFWVHLSQTPFLVKLLVEYTCLRLITLYKVVTEHICLTLSKDWAHLSSVSYLTNFWLRAPVLGPLPGKILIEHTNVSDPLPPQTLTDCICPGSLIFSNSGSAHRSGVLDRVMFWIHPPWVTYHFKFCLSTLVLSPWLCQVLSTPALGPLPFQVLAQHIGLESFTVSSSEYTFLVSLTLPNSRRAHRSWVFYCVKFWVHLHWVTYLVKFWLSALVWNPSPCQTLTEPTSSTCPVVPAALQCSLPAPCTCPMPAIINNLTQCKLYKDTNTCMHLHTEMHE